MNKLAIPYQIAFVIGLGLFTQQSLAADSGEEYFMEEIIVTAQKRSESLQDVAISVTAMTGETIQKLGMRQSTDISAQTPNFNVGYPNGENGVPSMFIRGVGLNDFGVTNAGPIATYVDEAYVASNAAQIFQLLDLERVEVLRGPQGTLYGRNATGGAINFVAKKPTDTFETNARLSYGTYNTAQFEASVSGPLTDNLAYRIALLKNYSDGWMENQLTGNDLNGTNDLAFRAILDYNPTDNFDLSVTLRGGKTKSDSTVYQHRGVLDPATFEPCAPAAIKRFECVDFLGYRETDAYDEGSYDLEAKNDTSFFGTGVKAIWDFKGYTFTYLANYDEIEDDRPEETDASPSDVLTVLLAVDQNTFSQEFRISREFTNLNWIAGVYYMQDEASDRSTFDLFRVFRDAVEAVDPVAYPGGFDPDGAALGLPVFKTFQTTVQDTNNWAFYYDLTWNFAEAWQLALGIRYTDEEIEQINRQGFIQPGLEIEVFNQFNRSSFNNTSGRVVLNWHPSDNTMLYASISTGFKAGGVNNPLLEPATPYSDESIRSYEIGSKSTLFNGRVRLNAAAFFYDYSDLQVFSTINSGGAISTILDNASDANIVGAEIESLILVSDNLMISLGLGLLDTEYKNFLNFAGVDPVTGDPTFADLSGNEVTMAPAVNFNGMVQYDIALSGGSEIQLQVDFSYQDDVFFDALNNPLLTQDGYWIWNARMTWASNNSHYEAGIWARNLGDEEYLSYAFDLSELGFHELMLGRPRTIGIELKYRL